MKIKFLTYLSLLLVLFASSIYASRVDDLMAEGNAAYQNEDFAEAQKKYEEILNEGFVSPGLYYNLGNTYFKLNQLGKSILNYERALDLSPTFENAQYNLDIAKARTIDKIKAVPELFIISWWNSILRLFSPTGWSVIVIIFYLSLLTIIALWFLTKSSNNKQLLSMFGLGNLVVVVFLSVLLYSSIKLETERDYGILLKSTVTVKASPNSNSEDAFVIHEGVKFLVQDELSDWAEIKLDDGKIGWLPKSTFETI